MLRITVHDNPESLTFQLEGRLAGPWVREVEDCRQRRLAGRRASLVCFGLTGVTFIDSENAGNTLIALVNRPLDRRRHKHPRSVTRHPFTQKTKRRVGSFSDQPLLIGPLFPERAASHTRTA